MTKYKTIELSIAAVAFATFAIPAAAQTTAATPAPADRPILVFGAVQDQHSTPNDRPIMVFGAIAQDQHSTPSDRPVVVFGAIRDRNAAPAAADPADRALAAMPVVYEDAPGQ
jgi:hypothetical protein